MKKVIFTFFAAILAIAGFSQATYYWVGGTGGSWGSSSSWSTTIGGGGGDRTTPSASDILVFDGTNIGGGATGTVAVQPTAETIGRLILQNGANLALQRTSSGTTYLSVSGLGTTADLAVDATSTLTVTGNLGTMAPVLEASATGQVFGTLNITGTATNRMSVKGTGALHFMNGSVNVVGSGTNPYSTLTTGTNPSVDRAVIYESGSTMVYTGGNNPFGTSTSNIVVFSPGSTLAFEAANVTNMFSSRVLSNIVVRNNATVTADGNWYNVDNILVEAGATFNLRVSGTHPVAGNITNNGTFGAASGFTTTNLIMIGTNTPQTIGGTGTFNPIGALTIGADADVTLNHSLVVNGSPTTSVLGKLNVQTYTITGIGNFQTRQAQTITPNATYTAGTNTVTVNDFTGITAGLKITSPNFPANTYVIATSSGNLQFTTNKPATVSASGIPITISAGDPTVALANAGGVDAALATTGATRSFGSGTNFIFNAATSTPFSTTASIGNAFGDLTLNAAIVANRSAEIDGTLTLNSGNLTIPANDTIRIHSGNAIAGAPFSLAKHVITLVDAATGDHGVLAIDNVTTSALFPVGNSAYYLPAIVTPASASDFAVTAFTGITDNGMPNGTPLSAAQKQKLVDAVWLVNRPNGTGNAGLTLSWPAALEGSQFATYNNAEIGIAHNAGTWEVIGGSGDNVANTATNTFSQFSPFAVGGKVGELLPVSWKSFTGTTVGNAAQLSWTTVNEMNLEHYQLEKSTDGRKFTSIYTVAAKNNVRENGYSFIDADAKGVVYYRVVAIGKSGDVNYSNVVKLSFGKAITVSVYPNPATDVISISGLQLKDEVRIVDMKGNVVIRQQSAVGANAVTINVSALPKGSYIVEVSRDGSKEAKTFIKN